MLRVTIAQFDGPTTLRASPLAAGQLAAMPRREAGLADATPAVGRAGCGDALRAPGRARWPRAPIESLDDASPDPPAGPPPDPPA